MWPLLLVLCLLLTGMGWYFFAFYRRAIGSFRKAPKDGRAWLIPGSLTLVTLLSFMAGEGLGLIVALHVVFISELLHLVGFLARWLGGKVYPRAGRFLKKLWQQGVAALVLTALVLSLGYYNMHQVRATEYTVTTTKSIRPQGYRVALVADVHFEVSLDLEELQKVCQEIERSQPDLLILCGDIVDDGTSPETLGEVFRAFGSVNCPLGVFYVFGNHDRPMDLLPGGYTEQTLRESVEAAGISILQDEALPLTVDLTLAGREDRGYGDEERRMPVGWLLQDADPDTFILTLDHQPVDYEACALSPTDLVLSGHTHGGQFWPVNLLDRLFGFNDWNYGHTWLDHDTQAIVTSGLAGWRYPIKTAAPAEYVIIQISPDTD